jgi:hypothetical protein
MIVVVGTGIVGTHVAELLRQRGHEVRSVSHNTINEVSPEETEVVVLAHAGHHERVARRFLQHGCSVVSVGDDSKDVLSLLDLQSDALSAGRTLIVGAACSPGLSGLLVHYLGAKFDEYDEIHVAVHGTAGPQCAHQHHRVLSGTALGWHDDEWLKRPAGSGRELCWFPEPIGSRDCYRADLADALLLKHSFSHANRISARVSATRRDRILGRLPMLIPPHIDGDMGAVRVEVRGVKNGQRTVEIAGAAHPMGHIAGAVAAATAHEIIQRSGTEGVFVPGVFALGAEELPNTAIFETVINSGVRVQQFYGVH